jgi:hypothetical protein
VNSCAPEGPVVPANSSCYYLFAMLKPAWQNRIQKY